MDISFFPPVKFGDVMNTTFEKPFFVSKWDEELDVGMYLLDFHDRRVGQMIVVIMTIVFLPTLSATPLASSPSSHIEAYLIITASMVGISSISHGIGV